MCIAISAWSRSARRAGCARRAGSTTVAGGAGAVRAEPGADDRVALEVTGSAWEIARHPRAACRRSRHRQSAAGASDQPREGQERPRFDARRLAELLAADLLDRGVDPRRVNAHAAASVQAPLSDRRGDGRARRMCSRRCSATSTPSRRGSTCSANAVARGSPRLSWRPMSAQTIAGDLRQFDFLAAELKVVDREIAQISLTREDIKRLMTIRGGRHDHRPDDGRHDRRRVTLPDQPASHRLPRAGRQGAAVRDGRGAHRPDL